MAGRYLDPSRVQIDPRKLRDYALNPAHETGRFKASFFAQMGYNAQNWDQLEQDIRDQHLTQMAQEGQRSPFGQKFTITAPIQGPAGERRWVTTVWIIRTEKDWAELVTLEPAKRRRSS